MGATYAVDQAEHRSPSSAAIAFMPGAGGRSSGRTRAEYSTLRRSRVLRNSVSAWLAFIVPVAICAGMSPSVEPRLTASDGSEMWRIVSLFSVSKPRLTTVSSAWPEQSEKSTAARTLAWRAGVSVFDKHRCGLRPHDSFQRCPDQHVLEQVLAMRSHHNQIGGGVSCKLDDGVARKATYHARAASNLVGWRYRSYHRLEFTGRQNFHGASKVLGLVTLHHVSDDQLRQALRG